MEYAACFVFDRRCSVQSSQEPYDIRAAAVPPVLAFPGYVSARRPTANL